MKKTSKIAAYVCALLFIALFGVPMLAQWLGWHPTQTTGIEYHSKQLGISIAHSLACDEGVWQWREVAFKHPAGVFLDLRNNKVGHVAFFFFPATGVVTQTWMQDMRKRGQYFSNMKYQEMLIDGVEWVEETSDYSCQGKKLRYYMIATRHKNRFLHMEAYTRPEDFEKALPFFRDLASSIELAP